MGVEMEWGGKREKKTGEKLSVTMAAHFLFFPQWNQPVKKCVFVNGVGCKADMAVLSELLVHFAALRIPFCVSIEIREQTITVISSQWITRAAHADRLQITLVCALVVLVHFSKEWFLGYFKAKMFFFSGVCAFLPHVGLSLILIKKWWMKESN